MVLTFEHLVLTINTIRSGGCPLRERNFLLLRKPNVGPEVTKYVHYLSSTSILRILNMLGKMMNNNSDLSDVVLADMTGVQSLDPGPVDDGGRCDDIVAVTFGSHAQSNPVVVVILAVVLLFQSNPEVVVIVAVQWSSCLRMDSPHYIVTEVCARDALSFQYLPRRAGVRARAHQTPLTESQSVGSVPASVIQLNLEE